MQLGFFGVLRALCTGTVERALSAKENGLLVCIIIFLNSVRVIVPGTAVPNTVVGVAKPSGGPRIAIYTS